MTDIQKIKSLIQHYGYNRAQEELAGSRDAPFSTLKRYGDQGETAYNKLMKIIENLLTVRDAAKAAIDNEDAWSPAFTNEHEALRLAVMT